jgi:putative RecB family exonuclease
MIAILENGSGPVAEVSPLEKLKRTVSASRLNCWLQCRLKFYFRYVLKIAKPKTAALHYGSVVHLVLQQWNLARWRKQPFEIEKLKQGFETGWLEQGGAIDWDGEELEQKASAWAVLEKYFTATPIQADELPEAVEVPVEADLAPHGLPILIGILDLVRAGVAGLWTSSRQPRHRTRKWHCTRTRFSSTATRCCIGKPWANVKPAGNCITSSRPRCPR